MAFPDTTLPKERPIDHVRLDHDRTHARWADCRTMIHVEQRFLGGPILVREITLDHQHTNEFLDLVELTEAEAAHLGVLLTLITDAELCMAARMAIMEGPEGSRILARQMKRVQQKNAAAATAAGTVVPTSTTLDVDPLSPPPPPKAYQYQSEPLTTAEPHHTMMTFDGRLPMTTKFPRMP